MSDRRGDAYHVITDRGTRSQSLEDNGTSVCNGGSVTHALHGDGGSVTHALRGDIMTVLVAL